MLFSQEHPMFFSPKNIKFDEIPETIKLIKTKHSFINKLINLPITRRYKFLNKNTAGYNYEYMYVLTGCMYVRVCVFKKVYIHICMNKGK